MMPKDHNQVSVSWTSKRGQRCLGFTVIFALILFLGLLEQSSWPDRSELRLEYALDDVYTYSSKPEAGAPGMPLRKVSDQPWFWLEDEEEMATEYANVEIRPEAESSGISRRETEDREGVLIGLH